jgi:hypothetical protein
VVDGDSHPSISCSSGSFPDKTELAPGYSVRS